MGNRRETIERIKNSARKLFWENGFKDVTMQQIADDAEITKGLLNHYFPQKNDIVSAINYQDFMRVFNYAKEHADADSFLAYLIASYMIKKASIDNPQIREIEVESLSSKKALNNEASKDEKHSFDAVYIEIIKQFNLYISLTEMNTRVIMARGACDFLAKTYQRMPERISVDDYLEHSVLATAVMFDIPHFTRTEYYDRALDIINSGIIPEFSYTKNNYI